MSSIKEKIKWLFHLLDKHAESLGPTNMIVICFINKIK